MRRSSRTACCTHDSWNGSASWIAGSLRTLPSIVIWLTTGEEFRAQLVVATSRNRRILLSSDFVLTGPDRGEWPAIIEETFEFHNGGRPLADYEVLPPGCKDRGNAGRCD